MSNGELKWSRFSSILSRWENLGRQKKFDQEAKDRVVRLVEDRILAEGLSVNVACQAVAPKLGFSGTPRVCGCKKPARVAALCVLRKM